MNEQVNRPRRRGRNNIVWIWESGSDGWGDGRGDSTYHIHSTWVRCHPFKILLLLWNITKYACTETHRTHHANVSVRTNMIGIVFRVWMGDWVCTSKKYSFHNGHVLHQQYQAASAPLLLDEFHYFICHNLFVSFCTWKPNQRKNSSSSGTNKLHNISI